MKRSIYAILILAALAPSLSACGRKGSLKTPEQAAAAEAKKAAKEAKKSGQQPAQEEAPE